MRSVLNIVVKELLQLRRDPVRLRLMLVLPVIQLILLGYAANLDVKKIPLIVHDADRSAAGRDLTGRFLASGYFELRGFAEGPDEVDRAVSRGSASLALVIPRGFGSDLLARRPASLQVIADGSDATFAGRGLNYAGMIVREFSTDVVLRRTTLEPAGVDARIRVWYNPELDSRWFLVPGILALVLMVVSLIGTAMTLVREKEIGTMEQLIVTPIRPVHLILGKLIPNAGIGMFVISVVLILVHLLFRIPIEGSLTLLLGLSFVFLVSMQGIGLFVSTASRTQQQAMMSAIFFVMLPMLLLSGFVFPIENMPEVIQGITYIIPLRYYFVILRGILLKGAGMAVLWDESLALTVCAVAAVGLSVWRLRKRTR